MFELDVVESSVRFDRIKTDSISLEEKSVDVKKSHHLVLSKNIRFLGEVWNCTADLACVFRDPLPHLLFTLADFLLSRLSTEDHSPLAMSTPLTPASRPLQFKLLMFPMARPLLATPSVT